MAAGTLTAVALRAIMPDAKTRRFFDGNGLYLEVTPAGARYWRMKYRHGGKEKRIAFGVFPEVTLAEARDRRDQARALLRDGRDPSAERQADRRQARLAAGTTFAAVAKEWLDLQRAALAPSTLKIVEWQFGKLFPSLGHRPIAELTAAEILAVLRPIEAAGLRDTTHRMKQRIGQVCRYAIATGRAERDPAADLRGALAPVVTTPRAAITNPEEIGHLLRALDHYHGQPTTCVALKLAPLLFVRPGNLRTMEWRELNLDAAEWRIPSGKMKMKEAHVVPLATQAVALLRELQPLTGHTRYVFPGLGTIRDPISDVAINGALRRMGYDKETMTGHGFRAMASSRLNEMGWSPDVIERQLAHAPRNKVRAAYNRAQYLDERRKMMQAWADYLDQLRADDTSARRDHR
jgi:integrase